LGAVKGRYAIDDRLGWGHFGWIPIAATVGFSSAFVLTDVLQVPVLAYHLVHFCLLGLLVAVYGRTTRLRIGAVIRPRLVLAITLGGITGLALMRRVLADPPSSGASGILLAWTYCGGASSTAPSMAFCFRRSRGS
jgi:hypothetical protein